MTKSNAGDNDERIDRRLSRRALDDLAVSEEGFDDGVTISAAKARERFGIADSR